jgi:8-oxo-dGTP diphosphatase
MRRSARALIIQDKKLLLVGNNEIDMLWSPGGGIEDGESALDALPRELDEELGLKIKSAKQYEHYIHKGPEGKKELDMQYFLVEVEDTPVPNNEVERIYWYSKEDYKSGNLKISPTIGKTILPKLIEDDLL